MLKQVPFYEESDAAALVPAQQNAALLDGMVQAWLHEKYKHSNSPKTERAYRDVIGRFRAALHAAETDLDGPPAMIALIAQSWANTPWSGAGDVSASTYNQRVAILSSFYRYAIKKQVLHDNPLLQLDRRKVDRYAGAQPLEHEEVSRCLGLLIDEMGGDPALVRTQAAARDYALLSIAFTTGRRVGEIGSLRWGDVKRARSGVITLRFRRAKGGKKVDDTLDSPVAEALLRWLQLAYGERELTPDMPVWIALDNRHQGHPLTTRALEAIAEKRLGTGRFHVTRHTFAYEMEEAGAKLSEIQAKLLHDNIATTGIYLATLRRPENKYVGRLSARLGIGKRGPTVERCQEEQNTLDSSEGQQAWQGDEKGTEQP